MATIRKIQRYFNFPEKMNVNGEWVVSVDDDKWEKLKEAERKGYLDIRNK